MLNAAVGELLRQLSAPKSFTGEDEDGVIARDTTDHIW